MTYLVDKLVATRYLHLGKSCFLPAKRWYMGKSGCNWEKLLNLGTSGGIQAKWLHLSKCGCIRAM